MVTVVEESMSEVRILLNTDKLAIVQFARAQLALRVQDPMEREMQSWTAPWREESLDHYLPQGWCYGTFDANGGMTGFLLAQPVLFYRGHTQTLWIEHINAFDGALVEQLLDTVYRWARDKHFQCVVLEPHNDWSDWLELRRPQKTPALIELRTVRS